MRKFFTWVEEGEYKNANEVPSRLQEYIRELHFKDGKPVHMLALATNLPEDWVAEIVRKGGSEDQKLH